MREFKVYTYTDPRNNQIIYVGKGCGERHLFHWKYGNPQNNHFDRKLNKIRAAGLKPLVKIVHTTKDESEAYELEELLIREIGRYRDGGTLCNITLGGEGHSILDLPEEFYSKLGKQTDRSLANEYNLKHASTVTKIRKDKGIPVFKRFNEDFELKGNSFVWKDSDIKLLGTMKDLDVANLLGIGKSTVRRKRSSLGIPSHCGKKEYSLKDKHKSWSLKRNYINDFTGERKFMSVDELQELTGCCHRSARRTIVTSKYRKPIQGWRLENE